MDLAFSGLLSAAKDAHASLEDACFSLQETAFAMCVEVTERALAQTGKDEMILVGGVGVNRRLQQMLMSMCEDRGAQFGVPPSEYLGDNGAMIAYTGRLMLEQGNTTPICESYVNPSFRADQVPVTWRDAGDMSRYLSQTSFPGQADRQGAEARIQIGTDVLKQRFRKQYRDANLDQRLITERTRAEARLMSYARRAGVPTPVIYDITSDTITMEMISGRLLKEVLTKEHLMTAGIMVGTLHNAGIIHGDLTTCNMIIRDSQCVLIDFGLATTSSDIEARGVDIHVLFQILKSTSSDAEMLKSAFCNGYQSVFPEAALVLAREHEIELRGRYL
jgi:N6-L-threonylcarbamoyladenine synthase/protein kinase Bud32